MQNALLALNPAQEADVEEFVSSGVTWTFRANSGLGNNNYNSHDNVYGAVIMTIVIARVHPVHLMNVD